MCGEHSVFVGDADVASGSSPRVRGTPRGVAGEQVMHGIIPACAGNTHRVELLYACGWDHPRVCGEHVCGGHFGLSFPGSSPRVRGTRTMKPTPCVRRGIIPACAGNTCSKRNHLNIVGDHPRVCGEHTRFVVKSKVAVGSSPRVRGTRLWWSFWFVLSGIIPACAGNTNYEAYALRKAWDHPRVCGEHMFQTQSFKYCRGSSPRVRGTH